MRSFDCAYGLGPLLEVCGRFFPAGSQRLNNKFDLKWLFLRNQHDLKLVYLIQRTSIPLLGELLFGSANSETTLANKRILSFFWSPDKALYGLQKLCPVFEAADATLGLSLFRLRSRTKAL
jgi:hypothetical protein